MEKAPLKREAFSALIIVFDCDGEVVITLNRYTIYFAWFPFWH
jgi:hypothetical protein